jgi:hypothetical protein
MEPPQKKQKINVYDTAMTATTSLMEDVSNHTMFLVFQELAMNQHMQESMSMAKIIRRSLREVMIYFDAGTFPGEHCYILDLPETHVEIILSYLTPNNRVGVARVCKEFNTLIKPKPKRMNMAVLAKYWFKPPTSGVYM